MTHNQLRATLYLLACVLLIVSLAAVYFQVFPIRQVLPVLGQPGNSAAQAAEIQNTPFIDPAIWPECVQDVDQPELGLPGCFDGNVCVAGRCATPSP